MNLGRKLTRRAALRTVGAAGGALLVLPVVGCGGGEPDCSDMSGVDPAARQMRTTLHYVDSATDALFRTNHASNYLPLGGRLPRDRARIVALIDRALDGETQVRPALAKDIPA